MKVPGIDVLTPVGVLCFLSLASGCSSGMRGGPAGVPVAHAADDNARQPVVPQQFAPVAGADWTVNMPLVGGEIACRNGKAMIFDCQNVNLLAFLPIRVLGDSIASGVTGLWGWTDAKTGREFVIAGHYSATSFIEITDPLNPRYLGSLLLKGDRSLYREIKVYQHYAFIVSEASQFGMQVFDLTQLLRIKTAPAALQETAHYDHFATAHNIALDTVSGFAYAVGIREGLETCGGGLHMIDVRDPLHPAFVGCYPETLGGTHNGYIHDAECITYRGPDRKYRGHEICLNAAETAVGIVDVTDKKHPETISIASYPNAGYTHQGWLTDDQRYFVLGDEFDERQSRSNTRTIIFDLKSLSDPVVAKEFFGTTKATDHNLYIRGRYVYQSNYMAGLRVLDASDPVNPKEVGYFKNTIEEITPAMDGSWANYPYFRDGVVAVGNFGVRTGGGLYIVRYRPQIP